MHLFHGDFLPKDWVVEAFAQTAERNVNWPEKRHRGSQDAFRAAWRGGQSGQRSGELGCSRRIDILSELQDLAILDVSNDAGGQRQLAAIGQRPRHRVFLDETPVSGAANDFFVTEIVDYGAHSLGKLDERFDIKLVIQILSCPKLRCTQTSNGIHVSYLKGRKQVGGNLLVVHLRILSR